MKLFNDAFCELLNTMKQEKNLIYLMGDYNINLLNYGKHNETRAVSDCLIRPLPASVNALLVNCA